MQITIPLAVGGAVGGVVGKQSYSSIAAMYPNPDTVGAWQAALLAVVTFGTLVYTLCKKRITTHHIDHPIACTLIGFALGVLSSFLGIGGGPINLVVLFFFFSLDKVECGDNSQEHTVRDWLDSFGIPVVDQYYIRWQRIAMHASRVIKSVEDSWTTRGINMLLTLVFNVLYLGYDMKKEFEPQFTERAEELRGILSKIESGMGGAANAG